MYYFQSIYYINKYNKKNYISNFLLNKIYKFIKFEFVRKNNLFLLFNCYCVNNFKMLQIEKFIQKFQKRKRKKLNFFVKEENVNMFDILFYIKDNLLKYLFDIYSILFVLI